MKRLIRHLCVAALSAVVAAGWAVSAATAPAAAADTCNDEAADQNVYVGSYSVGVDNGTTGLVGVAAVCVRGVYDDPPILLGGGAHVYIDGAGDPHADPYLCFFINSENSEYNTCQPIL